MKIASIDIGTNTVLLLIAEVSRKLKTIRPILNKYEMPRLGKDLIPGGQIKEEKIIVLYNVLEKYKNIIEQEECETVLINATNAFRIASNAKSIADQIKVKFGFDVNIIDGATEAKYSFLGAISSFDKGKEYLVIDIGGGSTELIFGSINKIKFKKSFGFGVVSLAEKFFVHNPPTLSEVQDILNNTKVQLNEITDTIPKNPTTIAVAGTPTTLSCIKQNLKEYDENKVEKSIITYAELNDMIYTLSKITSNRIKELYGKVVEGREDVLLPGALILKTLSNLLQLDKFFVSGRGIRYGAVINYLEKNG
ncbi:exopolyphosphatase [bacterium BMS3Abin04]|nr:exopolyphosphatase [bacterium BMS3Abin04]